MRDDITALRELLREGTCCAAALVQVALERGGRRNDELVRAVRGLCSGVHSGLVCGALTGAACAMNVLDPDANTRMVPELAEWFLATIGSEYGGISCDAIVGDDSARMTTRCPAVVVATYRQAMAIMERFGHRPD